MTLPAMTEKLGQSLKPKRFAHSLGVADTAKRLAELHGADPEKAYLAGILHDCAKYLTADEMLQTALALHISVDEWERESPELLHAKLGAAIAQREYGVADEDVLRAIERHIGGAPGMPLLDLLVNLSDYIEPGRDFSDVERLRELAWSDPETAMVEAFRGSMIHILKKHMILYPTTVYTYNDLLARIAARSDES